MCKRFGFQYKSNLFIVCFQTSCVTYHSESFSVFYSNYVLYSQTRPTYSWHFFPSSSVYERERSALVSETLVVCS